MATLDQLERAEEYRVAIKLKGREVSATLLQLQTQSISLEELDELEEGSVDYVLNKVRKVLVELGAIRDEIPPPNSSHERAVPDTLRSPISEMACHDSTNDED